MDFYKIKSRPVKQGVIELSPDFKVCKCKDLMIRGKSFYAIWDEEKGLWSTDEYEVQRLVDEELIKARDDETKNSDSIVKVKLMMEFSNKSWVEYRNFMKNISDNSHQLDTELTFQNTEIKKKDYVSKKLPYPLEEGRCDAFDELIGTLYDPEERAKLEWAIGAVIAGDAKNIQKFIVLYGEAGAGKSTILNIIQKLFEGYYTTFEAKALTTNNNSFAMEVFRTNPLVAIQHDGDLSKIEDNTKLNSIISHEEMTMNEKYKPSYTSRVNCFLFMATNKPVKITDAKSGIIRRLIDVKPSGKRLPSKKYMALMSKIDFELGAIAQHCFNVYKNMGKHYYNSYKPLEMMFQTDMFFNFVEDNFYEFKKDDGITLSRAFTLYKEYCEDSLIDYKLSKTKFREELRNYFKYFSGGTAIRVNGVITRNYYSGFLDTKFNSESKKEEEIPNTLVLDSTESIFDKECSECLAQYANEYDTPNKKWADVKTKLKDIDTSQVHYVRLPENHIVVDFDLKDDKGEKSLELNTEAASKWPPTYAEYSKSQAGVHLHYIYEGDPNQLSRLYSEGIEIKVFNGNSSLRRKLSKCNHIPIATINSGLPLKGEKMINFESVKSEKGLRELIKRNMEKEIHAGTKPSMDFIYKILEDAYNSGLGYDITDMRPRLLAFASNSSHQADYCIKLLGQMKLKSEDISSPLNDYDPKEELMFFDVEVFPNLFVVVCKTKGKQAVKMINPTPLEIESLLKYRLVGFNCRRYDNHIMYARYIGYTNAELYTLSQRIISNSPNCMFGEAYNLSYTDVYDFASAGNKKSLKKFEIELGIHHQELGLPWDEPVPEELWTKVAEYCVNDVEATEAVFDHLVGDWTARQILAELSGLTVNDTTNAHSTRIIFGTNRKPQDVFVYTDLSEQFPGYKFDFGKSTYRGEEVSEGGHVYSEPGMYTKVALLDVASMHPSSIELLDMFGPYTKKFSEIKKARLAIKHDNYEAASKMLDGKLAKFLNNPNYKSDDLSNALKTVINSVYGLTSAKFENAFRDPRNIDNIVAKRGALFMVDLKYAVQEKGFTVAHIKTDSIKIPNATEEIIQFVMDFGLKYGYDFEHEATYEKMCLVNDAVYIAKYDSKGLIGKGGKHAGEWTATGAQFIQPYVFKSLFSKELLTFADTCETKSVTTALYLDMNEDLPPEEHKYHFVGKVGSFCPIKPGKGGGILLREKEGNYHAASGSKGFRWLEAEMVHILNKEADIDHAYYNKLVDDALTNISNFGDTEWFIYSESPKPRNLCSTPCGKNNDTLCESCNNLSEEEDILLCKLGSHFKPTLLPF